MKNFMKRKAKIERKTKTLISQQFTVPSTQLFNAESIRSNNHVWKKGTAWTNYRW